MAYTSEQIAHVAESLYFRYAGEILCCLSVEENLQILRNITLLRDFLCLGLRRGREMADEVNWSNGSEERTLEDSKN